jgi:hypothetical protein
VPLAVQENLVKHTLTYTIRITEKFTTYSTRDTGGLTWIETLRKFARLASNVYPGK